MTDQSHDFYANPLVSRYSSASMKRIFSDRKKFSTWRRLWLELARAERALGLDITEDQLEEMERHLEDIDFEAARAYEKKFRHDVMAHIHTFGDVCPAARPIIHLGATSAYVGDNTDLVVTIEALDVIRLKLVNLIRNLAQFATEYRDLPTLGFTHFQPAQLTTVGKRACLWLQDVIMDYHDLAYVRGSIPFRGVKGTTGTQASFLALFDGDHDKVRKLDEMVSSAFGFPRAFAVTGQTYTRKVDSRVAAVLSGICQTLSKMATDLRLLSHLKEVEEPFGTSQVGSSAMPYKRNPMRSERICAISRFVMSLESSPAFTEASQWLERTLDDSANKRLSIPQMFLGTDAVLEIAINVTTGLVVNPAVINRHLDDELPFIASENLLMKAVRQGGDRQELHEEIRKFAHEAGRRMKQEGKRNEFLDLVRESPSFNLTDDDLSEILTPSLYIGRSPEQVDEFIASEVQPVLDAEKDAQTVDIDLDV